MFAWSSFENNKQIIGKTLMIIECLSTTDTLLKYFPYLHFYISYKETAYYYDLSFVPHLDTLRMPSQFYILIHYSKYKKPVHWNQEDHNLKASLGYIKALSQKP